MRPKDGVGASDKGILQLRLRFVQDDGTRMKNEEWWYDRKPIEEWVLAEHRGAKTSTVLKTPHFTLHFVLA